MTELIIIMCVLVPMFIGLCHVLYYIWDKKSLSDNTLKRMEPIIKDCAWTREQYYKK